MERIGFIGLGSMGHPMAQNLQKAGFPLTVYNRTPDKAQDFIGKASVADNIKALVENSDIIFTMLTNDAAVTEVYAQLVSLPISGKLFIDMSTIARQKSVETAALIQQQAASFIDAPVAGSTKPAADGTLIIMAGAAAADLERARPYLEKLGKRIVHLGENGTGIAAKLSINYFLSIIYQGLAETVLFAEKSGLSRSDMLDIINESACGSAATQIKTPSLLADEYKPAFALDLMLKDILLAKQAGADFPFAAVLEQSYQAAHDQGYGQDDVMSIINFLKK